jgi:Holliday junction resolvase-like predicted endonuclease
VVIGAEGDEHGGPPKEPSVAVGAEGGDHGPVSTRDRGRAVEQAVAAHLRAHGLRIVDQNYTGGGAELDLVACEPAPGGTDNKQRRVIRAATAWLVAHDLWERVEVRFDVVAVEHGHEPTWIRGAFEADR